MNLRNLKRSWLLPVALILFLFGNNANAFYSTGANPTSVGAIEVVLADSAKDACWTNLKETRQYAEEKLRNKGYSTAAKPDGYRFIISVISFRLKSRSECVYAINLQVYKGYFVDDVYGFHEIGSRSVAGIRPTNANNEVIISVQELIDEM